MILFILFYFSAVENMSWKGFFFFFSRVSKGYTYTYPLSFFFFLISSRDGGEKNKGKDPQLHQGKTNTVVWNYGWALPAPPFAFCRCQIRWEETKKKKIACITLIFLCGSSPFHSPFLSRQASGASHRMLHIVRVYCLVTSCCLFSGIGRWQSVSFIK